MSDHLARVTEKARSEKKLVFTSLMHHLTLDRLWDCLNSITSRSAPGVDGMDVQTAKETFDDWAPAMLEAVHRKGYRAPPVRRVYIPKPGKSEQRPIGIPTIADRALQRAVGKILESIFEPDFCDMSFGGRPGRSAHNAVSTLVWAITRKEVSWVLEADLKSFFTSLDHDWVRQFLSQPVADPRMTTLIERWLKAGVLEEEVVERSLTGTPQGGPVSVLLSNLYLHYALDLWIERVVKPKVDGEVYYVRYLDDFVLCFQSRATAERVQAVLPKRLAKFGLSLAESKTRLVRFGRCAARDAHRNGERLQTLYFLGFTLYCSKSQRGHFVVGIKTEKGRLSRFLNGLKGQMRRWRHLPLRTQADLINRRLVGHYNYYALSGNIEALRSVYYATLKFWRRMLSSRSQRGRLNWAKYREILSYYPLRRPRIRICHTRIAQLAYL